MQRSITYKRFITQLIYLVIFVFYESLSSIYLFLPPLFSLLYILMSEALRKNDTLSLFFISLMLLFFEADKGFLVFSSIIYFILIYRFVMPKIEQNFSCYGCVHLFYVVFAYIGYFVFAQFLSSIFLILEPHMNWYMLYYIVIEFFLLSIL